LAAWLLSFQPQTSYWHSAGCGPFCIASSPISLLLPHMPLKLPIQWVIVWREFEKGKHTNWEMRAMSTLIHHAKFSCLTCGVHCFCASCYGFFPQSSVVVFWQIRIPDYQIFAYHVYETISIHILWVVNEWSHFANWYWAVYECRDYQLIAEYCHRLSTDQHWTNAGTSARFLQQVAVILHVDGDQMCSMLSQVMSWQLSPI